MQGINVLYRSSHRYLLIYKAMFALFLNSWYPNTKSNIVETLPHFANGRMRMCKKDKPGILYRSGKGFDFFRSSNKDHKPEWV